MVMRHGQQTDWFRLVDEVRVVRKPLERATANFLYFDGERSPAPGDPQQSVFEVQAKFSP